MIAVLDELGPAVQAFDLNGALLKHEVLSLDASPGVLQLESGTSDPATGRIFLVNQDTAFVDDFIWILTPVNPPICPHSNTACVASDIFPIGGGDCQINLSDLGVVLSNFAPGVPGKSRAQGDIFPLVGDSVVDLSDLGQMLSDFGADCR